MTLNITVPNDPKSYFSKAGDYYPLMSGGDYVGMWAGKAAARLGLHGVGQMKDFFALIDNRHPETGRRLTKYDRDDRRPMFDVTVAVPKSVAAMRNLLGDERVEQVIWKANDAVMHLVEERMAVRVRKGQADHDRVVGNAAWLPFYHRTSRPVGGIADFGDHIHNCFMNLAWDDVEHQWKAIQMGDIKADGPWLQAVFHNELARGLREIGYDTRHTKDAFEITGVPDAVIKKFSRRTAVIDKAAEKLGIKNPASKAKLAATTRERKTDKLTPEEQKAEWVSRLTDAEKQQLGDVFRRSIEREGRKIAERSHEAVTFALEHILERQSVVEPEKVLLEAMKRGVGEVTADGLRRDLAARDDVVRLKDGFITTKKVLATEQAVVDWAVKGRGVKKPFDLRAVYRIRDGRLNAGQRRALWHVLNSRDKLIIIRGLAGSGKTTLYSELVPALRELGQHVTLLAPTAQASRVVLAEHFPEAETVARFLLDKKMQEAARSGVIVVDEASLLDLKSLSKLTDLADRLDTRIILSGDRRQHTAVAFGEPLSLLEDQAGVPVVELDEILRQKGDYRDAVKLLAKGDVAKGFKALDKMGAIKELDHVGGVTDMIPEPYLGEVVSQGNGVSLILNRPVAGEIPLVPGGDFDLSAGRQGGETLARSTSYYAPIADEYVAALQKGQSVVLVSPTHKEADAVTMAIRSKLKEEGTLHGDEREFTRLVPLHSSEVERSEGQFPHDAVAQFVRNSGEYKSGDRARATELGDKDRVGSRFALYQPGRIDITPGDFIRVTANGWDKTRSHRVTNGVTYQVAGFTDQGDIRLSNNWVLDKEFGHLAYGYAAPTSHASQGRTADKVIVVQTAASYGASNATQLYVSASRGKEGLSIWTDDKEKLLEAVKREDRQTHAVELLEKPKPRKPWRKRVRQHLMTLRRQAERLIRAGREEHHPHEPMRFRELGR